MLSAIFYGIFSVACILFCLYCLVLYIKRWQRNDIVYDNHAFFLTVIFGTALSALVLYLLFRQTEGTLFVPSLLAGFCIVGLLFWHNDVVYFTEDSFTVRNVFGVCRSWKYEELTNITERTMHRRRKRSEVHCTYYVGDRSFTLSRNCMNYGEFAECVRRHCRGRLAP